MQMTKVDRGLSFKDENDEFLIHFGGSDLYFTMYNYHEDNQFIITKDDYIYDMFSELFEIVLKEKKPWNNIIENNTIIWYSESYGVKENANKLFITKYDDVFIIKFYLNKNSYMANKNVCPVAFCLSGSNYQSIPNFLAIKLNEIMRENLSKTLK